MNGEIEARRVLREQVSRFASQKEMAAALGITQSYLSRMLQGRDRISDRILELLGYRRETRIVKNE